VLPRSLLRETVEVEVYRGHHAFGAVYGPPRRVRCTINSTRRHVIGPEGEDTIGEATLVFGLEAVVPVGSRIVVDGTRRRVIQVKTPRLLGRPNHREVVVA
jgi:hypothetical protein